MKPSIYSIIAIVGVTLPFMLMLGPALGQNSAGKNNTTENIAGSSTYAGAFENNTAENNATRSNTTENVAENNTAENAIESITAESSNNSSTVGSDMESNSVIFWSNIGGRLFLNSSFGEAVEAYDKALESDPANVVIMNNKGKALANQGNYDGAMMVFEEAIRLAPSNKESWTNKGYCFNCSEQV